MIRLKGPIRELLDETASDERAARIEQAVSARRLGRTAPKSPWLPFAAGALAMAAAAAVFALFSARGPVEPQAEPQPNKEIAGAVKAPAELPLDEQFEFPLPESSREIWVPAESKAKTVRVDPRRVDSSGSKVALQAEAMKLTTVDSLLAAADSSRGAGEYSAALSIFAEIYTKYSSDPRAGLAAFSAARIEQDTLRHPLEAAQKIEIALQLGLASELREPARARLFDAYRGAGDTLSAGRAAADYLVHHPSGERAAEARRIAGGVAE
jgi:hypothetical protein